ncbi:MAG: carbonic anhydrase, partial [Candidatus Moranbacteria bacterium]|nr:carbonic anhydrase [Candidatus Moranbacteria bacterium]
MKHKILPVVKESDIPREYRGNPIGLLLEYHNLNRALEKYSEARILI